MISKAKLKYIHSLQTKKGRTVNSVFVAEGPKIVSDLLSAYQPEMVLATTDWLKQHQQHLLKTHEQITANQVIEVTQDELQKASFLQHPQDVMCVFKQHTRQPKVDPMSELVLVLDGIQDPGNLGTIIRIADWFGIKNIICSEGTADVYNPKVIQATMGSIARVHVMYTNLCSYIDSLPETVAIYGTLLDGQDIYQETLTDTGIIIMGNEGNGISQEMRKRINKPLLIPNFAKDPHTADSLNVAIATAITCSEFKRRHQ